MKLAENLIVTQATTLIPDLGAHAVGLILAVEQRLGRFGADGLSCRQESLETGFFRSLAGKQVDALVVTHKKLREYAVLVTSKPYGSALHVARLVMATPRLVNDLRRAVRLVDEGERRFEIGAELDLLDLLLLDAFLSLTKLALREAVQSLAGKTRASDSEDDDTFFPE